MGKAGLPMTVRSEWRNAHTSHSGCGHLCPTLQPVGLLQPELPLRAPHPLASGQMCEGHSDTSPPCWPQAGCDRQEQHAAHTWAHHTCVSCTRPQHACAHIHVCVHTQACTYMYPHMHTPQNHTRAFVHTRACTHTHVQVQVLHQLVFL